MELPLRIILFVVYIVIVTPVALIVRILGYDPLAIKEHGESYWKKPLKTGDFQKQ